MKIKFSRPSCPAVLTLVTGGTGTMVLQLVFKGVSDLHLHLVRNPLSTAKGCSCLLPPGVILSPGQKTGFHCNQVNDCKKSFPLMHLHCIFIKFLQHVLLFAEAKSIHISIMILTKRPTSNVTFMWCCCPVLARFGITTNFFFYFGTWIRKPYWITPPSTG